VNPTLPDVIERAAASDPARFGYRFLDRHENPTWVPLADLRQRVATTASALHDQGIRAGDRVAIVLPTCPEFLDLFFAAQWIGAIPVALYPPVRLGRLEEYHARAASMLRAVGAAALYTDSRIGRVLGETIVQYRPRLGFRDVKGLRSGSPCDAMPSAADEIAMIQFSSGTTTDPKPVALTHAQMLANAERITASVFAASRPFEELVPSGVSWLPLYHDMGLVGCLLPALLGPGPLTLIPPELFLARPSVWLRAISRYRATTSPAPNFAYSLCVDRIRDDEMDGCDLSCWRLAMNGAEPLSARTIRRFEERFARWGFRNDAMMPVYGLSEATLAVTFTRPGTGWKSLRLDARLLGRGIARPLGARDSNATKEPACGATDEPGSGVSEWVSCGAPLPGFALEIRSDGGEVLGERRVGRIHVRGPSVMKGYYGRSDAPICAGWLDTGDLGFLDGGELYVTGRAKDMLVLRGQNHAPQDLERAVDAVSGVRTGCAAAVADLHADGETLVLFVEAREPHEELEAECREAVLAACGVAPDDVVVLAPGTLPRTSSGKIRRSETLRLWKEGSLDPPDAVGLRTIASAMLRSAAGYLRSRAGAGGGSA